MLVCCAEFPLTFWVSALREPPETRRFFGKVDHSRSDWPEQQRRIDRLRAAARRESTEKYKKKRLAYPVRYDVGPAEMEHDAVAALHEAQMGRCAICDTPISPFGRSRAVDRCRTTGRVRGMLCKPCNIGLGCFRDEPRRLVNALVYLDFLDKRFRQ